MARGVATLYGTVQSWAEHDLAGFTALRTPGIYRVINNLTVIYQQYSLRTISSVRY
ncbi:BON domain-containing protein [Silvimonas soli]|uniref:BON domain-containing protein n=1 Tax=Silvimonas soli TaxID=2980100 RepID=UPI0024B393FA|nr:BON domain-containing protein [Silvimonas soli]